VVRRCSNNPLALVHPKRSRPTTAKKDTDFDELCAFEPSC
jgi:hypothetical protein